MDRRGAVEQTPSQLQLPRAPENTGSPEHWPEQQHSSHQAGHHLLEFGVEPPSHLDDTQGDLPATRLTEAVEQVVDDCRPRHRPFGEADDLRAQDACVARDQLCVHNLQLRIRPATLVDRLPQGATGVPKKGKSAARAEHDGSLRHDHSRPGALIARRVSRIWARIDQP